LAGEEVDMPLLFFIDKDVLEDPACRNLDDVVLSYTFFKWVLISPGLGCHDCRCAHIEGVQGEAQCTGPIGT